MKKTLFVGFLFVTTFVSAQTEDGKTRKFEIGSTISMLHNSISGEEINDRNIFSFSSPSYALYSEILITQFTIQDRKNSFLIRPEFGIRSYSAMTYLNDTLPVSIREDYLNTPLTFHLKREISPNLSVNTGLGLDFMFLAYQKVFSNGALISEVNSSLGDIAKAGIKFSVSLEAVEDIAVYRLGFYFADPLFNISVKENLPNLNYNSIGVSVGYGFRF
jgi:hypothetical protein